MATREEVNNELQMVFILSIDFRSQIGFQATVTLSTQFKSRWKTF